MKLAAIAWPVRAITVPRMAPGTLPRRSRLARAVVLSGAAFTFAALFGMALAIETVKPQWRDPEFGHRLKQLQQLRAAHPYRPLVIAVGSSRTQMGFSPAAMNFADHADAPLAYNFGQSGAGPLHILLTVLRLLDAGVRPDLLLIELFPATLIHDGPAEQQLARIASRLTLADWKRLKPYTHDRVAVRKHWLADRANAWFTQRIVLMSHWQPNWLPWNKRLTFQWQQMDGYGFTPYPHEVMPPGEREKGLARNRADYGGMLAHFHIGTTTDRALHHLVQRCRHEEVPIAFYFTPESPAFQKLYPPETHTQIDAYCARLTAEFGVPFFDVTTNFTEDDFADGHHLLRHGASRFSSRLAQECLVPWLRSRTHIPRHKEGS